MFDTLDASATSVSERRFYLPVEHHPENGTLLGFWLYLMSDCLVFACLFAMYGVLGRSYAGGPTGAALFDLPLVAVNTSLLLLSSITYGFAMLQMERGDKAATLFWLGITGVFGAAFLGAAVLVGVLVVALIGSRVAGHLSRQLSRPLDEIVGWTERIARGEPLPVGPPRRGARRT